MRKKVFLRCVFVSALVTSLNGWAEANTATPLENSSINFSSPKTSEPNQDVSKPPPGALTSEIVLPGVDPEKSQREKKSIHNLCQEIASLYKKNKWGRLAHCMDIPFSIIGWSVKGRPLVSFEVGPAESTKKTVIQCGIHGDELPSLPMCLALIDEIRTQKRPPPGGFRIFVQPLLNPDGMLGKAKPTRNNANGVDINRNFPTKDWNEKAHASWKSKDRGDPRKFPGSKFNSEPETQAIVNFLEKEKPQKIISIHTPLGFLDLDTRGSKRGADPDKDRRARYLAVNMSKNSGNYKFKSFGFYPGSLGNWAGNERDIPVYTLELPPGQNKPTIENYWKRFRVALWRAIDFDLDTGLFAED